MLRLLLPVLPLLAHACMQVSGSSLVAKSTGLLVQTGNSDLMAEQGLLFARPEPGMGAGAGAGSSTLMLPVVATQQHLKRMVPSSNMSIYQLMALEMLYVS